MQRFQVNEQFADTVPRSQLRYLQPLVPRKELFLTPLTWKANSCDDPVAKISVVIFVVQIFLASHARSRDRLHISQLAMFLCDHTSKQTCIKVTPTLWEKLVQMMSISMSELFMFFNRRPWKGSTTHANNIIFNVMRQYTGTPYYVPKIWWPSVVKLSVEQ